uniref:Hypothetical chloroplast RF20 n=1 Tax=Symbiochloris handae TaxID=1853882 RepID=A0A097KJK8_9CHLO|nr:hypothetical chloroplast RF20 [Symbiochloris handae]AIT93376.1 hypothetical chloroplast RF20 [Symbiochloris handae]
MFFETRLSRYFVKILCNLKEKIFTVQSALSSVLFSLFTGFIFGNLFGTLLDTLRLYFLFNGFVGVFILLLVEAINSLVYGISFGNKNFSKNEKIPLGSFVIEDYTEQVFERSPTPLASLSHKSFLFKKFQKKTSSLLMYLSIKLRKIKILLCDITSPEFEEKKKVFYKNLSIIRQSIFGDIAKAMSNKLFFFYTNATQVKRTVNSFKIGLLFGFFVDSFKVGS